MSKELTEKWKNGELPNGSYYVKDWDGTIYRFLAQNKILWRDSNNPIYASERIEVLAPVPSYEKHKQLVRKIEQLERRLAIATKALEDYANSDEWELVDSKNVYWSRKRFPYPWRIADKALKEMEGVK